MAGLAYYTLELTRPPDGWSRLPELCAEARSATERLRTQGVRVRFVRVVFVPEDDACLCLYQAASADAVNQAAQRAGLAFGRIGPASRSTAIAEAVPKKGEQ